MASVTMEQMKVLLDGQTQSIEKSIKEQIKALDDKYDAKIKLIHEQQVKDKKEIDDKLAILFKELRDEDKDGNDKKRSRSVGAKPKDDIKDEVRVKLEKRVTVSGFMNNSTKDERETPINQFLGGLGTITNYGEHKVFAKGATGSEVVIEFSSKEVAKQFVMDNMKEIKAFKVKGKVGETRTTFFNRYLDEDQWKVYHATRLLAASLAGKMSHLVFKALKHKGIISINDFDAIKIKVGMDGNMDFKPLKQNIEDVGEEGLEVKLKGIISEFSAKFE